MKSPIETIIKLGKEKMGEGSGTPFQYSCLENPMDGGASSDMTERLHFHFSLSCIGEGNGSPPGSPVPRILQARTLEWVAISFSNA